MLPGSECRREAAQLPGVQCEPQNQAQTPIPALASATVCMPLGRVVTPSAWAASLVTAAPAQGVAGRIT